MISKIKPLFCLASLALAVPVLGQAKPAGSARPPMRVSAPQTHMAAPSSRVVRIPVRPVAPRPIFRVRGAQTNSLTTTNGVLNSSPVIFLPAGSTNFGLFSGTTNGVPGLGFDFAHLAALNQNFAEKAFIDPATQQQISLAEQLSSFSQPAVAAFPFFGGSEPVVFESQQQPPVIVVQQPAQQQQSTAQEAAPQPMAPQAEQQPLPDVGEFVLVLRDGTQIKAVAFTRQNQRIVYVTKDGKRESFTAADLDTLATQRINDERGTPLHLESFE